MRHKTNKLVMKRLWYEFVDNSMPLLHMIGMFVFAGLGIGLFLRDLITGFGVASSLGLFYIEKGYYYSEIMRRGMKDVEPTETKGE